MDCIAVNINLAIVVLKSYKIGIKMIKNVYRYISALFAMSLTGFVFWAGGHDFLVRSPNNGFFIAMIVVAGFLFFICPYLSRYDHD